MNYSPKPNYIGIIPAEVRYDESLTSNLKLLYAEITSLTQVEGYCWANNAYFAKLFGVSEKTIKRWLKTLEENQYIERELQYDEKGSISRRIIRLCITAKRECSTKKLSTICDQNSQLSKNCVNSENELSTKIDHLSTENIELSTPKGVGTTVSLGGGDKNVPHNNITFSKLSKNKPINKYYPEGGEEQIHKDFDLRKSELADLKDAYIKILNFKQGDDAWIMKSMLNTDSDKNRRIFMVIEAILCGSRLVHPVKIADKTVSARYFTNLAMKYTWEEIINIANAYRINQEWVVNPTFYILGIIVEKERCKEIKNRGIAHERIGQAGEDSAE